MKSHLFESHLTAEDFHPPPMDSRTESLSLDDSAHQPSQQSNIGSPEKTTVNRTFDTQPPINNINSGSDNPIDIKLNSTDLQIRIKNHDKGDPTQNTPVDQTTNLIQENMNNNLNTQAQNTPSLPAPQQSFLSNDAMVDIDDGFDEETGEVQYKSTGTMDRLLELEQRYISMRSRLTTTRLASKHIFGELQMSKEKWDQIQSANAKIELEKITLQSKVCFFPDFFRSLLGIFYLTSLPLNVYSHILLFPNVLLFLPRRTMSSK